MSSVVPVRRWISIVQWLLVLLLGVNDAVAQPKPPRESEVKAAFLYKFGNFVEWPAEALPAGDAPVVIGVVGDPDVAVELERLVAGRKINEHPVVARRLADPKQVASVHILFIGAMQDERLREFVPPPQVPVLVVTAQESGLRLGGCLNLTTEGGHIRFSAAPREAQSRGLKLSSRLLAVAQNVEGRIP